MNRDTQHTEDGLLFFFSFEKSQGRVKLSDVEIVPLWVNMYTQNGRKNYEIVAIDDAVTASSDFSQRAKDELDKSYSRTYKIVGDGLNKIKNYFSEN